ncbi:MAG TPA: hypothetical protein PK472_10600, partial [Pseudomonadota bacterium]|nr:hypothetical protein [Pseudomonadota bacterium]
RRRRSFDEHEHDRPPAAEAVVEETTPAARTIPSGEYEQLHDEEEAALAAFVAAMRSGRDED